MAFPNLVQRPGSRLWSEATGVPVNGPNTFALDLDPALVEAEWLFFDIQSLGPSVNGVSFVSLSADKTQITLDFIQTGTDAVRVVAQLLHTIPR